MLAVTTKGGRGANAMPWFAGRFSDPALRLRNEHGEPYAFVTFYLNDDDTRFSGGFSTTVNDGDEIIIVPALAGG